MPSRAPKSVYVQRTWPGVQEALGNLVLVGHEVEYKQRVVIDQTAHTLESPEGAHVMSNQIKNDTLTIPGTNPDKLPVKFAIRASAGHIQTVSQTGITIQAASYHLEIALNAGSAFTILPGGTADVVAGRNSHPHTADNYYGCVAGRWTVFKTTQAMVRFIISE